MMIKRMLKFALPALLFAAGASAFAAEEGETTTTGPVTLKDGTKVTWDAFASAVNNPTSVSTEVDSTALKTARKNYYDALNAQKVAPDTLEARTNALDAVKLRYKAANDSLQDFKDQRDNMSEAQKYTTGPIGWLKTIQTKATTFQTYFNKYYSSQGTQNKTDGSISYYTSGSDRWGYNLYISFSGAPAGSTGWEENKDVETFDNAIYGKTFSNVYLYLGQTNGVDNYPSNDGSYVLTYNGQSSTIANTIVSAISTLAKEDGYYEQTPTTTYQNLLTDISNKTKWVSKLAEVQSKLESQVTAAQNAVTNATANVTSTKAIFDEALSDYNKRVEEAKGAINKYYDVKITEDITVSTPITTTFTGTIDAGDNIITIENLPAGTTYLFSNFKGAHLDNAIINGLFAQGGNYNNVAAWRGENGIYYNTDGQGSTVNDLGKLAFDNRNLKFFGAELANNKIVKWSTASQVYDITLYEPNATTQFYTNIENGVFVNNPIEGFSTNALFESQTNDFGSINNVIFNKTCANLVIKDKQTFYSPYDFTATNVSVVRTLNAGYNTVCLPFELKKSNFATNDILCTYDKETTDKFWFTKVATSIPANTPVLMYLNANTDLSLSGVTIKQTPNTDLIFEYDKSNEDKSSALGFFKNITAGEIKGESNAYKVYGLQGGAGASADGAGAKFNPAGTATFGAFRMVIKSEIATKSGAPLMARGIAIVDEKGIEVNVGEWSGIEFVDMEASSLEVKGGQGEIIITTDANYGMQTVYALDGKAVATVDVVEGTNTVSVQSGVYVVMGQKVLVK